MFFGKKKAELNIQDLEFQLQANIMVAQSEFQLEEIRKAFLRTFKDFEIDKDILKANIDTLIEAAKAVGNNLRVIEEMNKSKGD